MSPSPGALLVSFFTKVDRWPDSLLAIESVLSDACGIKQSLDWTLGAQLVAGMQDSPYKHESWQCMGCTRPAAQSDQCSSRSPVPPTEIHDAGEKPPIHCEEACNDPSRADVLWKGASIDEPVTGPSVSPVIAGPSRSDVSSDMSLSTVGVQNYNRRASVRRAAKAKWIGGQRRAWARRCTRWRPKRRRRETASVRRRARRARRQALGHRDRQTVGQSTPGAFANPACLQKSGNAYVDESCMCECFACLDWVRVGLTDLLSGPTARWSGRPTAGVRFGEASHPGPAGTPLPDLLGGLGPGLIDSLKGMIVQLVQQAVQQSLAQAGLATAPSTSPRNARKKKAQPKKAALRKVIAGGSGRSATQAPSAPPSDSAAAQDQGKGKGKGKGKGVSQVPTAKGNGKGPQATAAAEDEWTLVATRRDTQAEVELRQQDWEATIIKYSHLASKFEASTDVVFRAVVQCMPNQVETAKNLLQASGRQHSVLLIEFAKDRKPTERKGDSSANARQRVPVKGGQLRPVPRCLCPSGHHCWD